MMLQLCTMAMVHCNNIVWVPMPIIHPENWLQVVENSLLFAQCARRTVRPLKVRPADCAHRTLQMSQVLRHLVEHGLTS